MDKIFHDDHIEALRNGVKQRALWLYTFLNKAKEKGIDYEEFGRDVIFSCGCIKGENGFPKTDSLLEFTKYYQSEDAIKMFDTKIIESSEDCLIVESYYCPLLDMWQQLSNDTHYIEKLCDIAMDGDRGIVSNYPNFEFKLKKALAFGDGKCRVEIRRK